MLANETVSNTHPTAEEWHPESLNRSAGRKFASGYTPPFRHRCTSGMKCIVEAINALRSCGAQLASNAYELFYFFGSWTPAEFRRIVTD
jgi:hypothetical protein